LCAELHLPVSWFVGNRCDIVGSDEDRGRSRRPGAEGRGWSRTSRVLGGQMIDRMGDNVCGLYRAQGDEEHGFFGLALKPRSIVCQWFGLKTIGTCFLVEPRNHV
jgi:hypothetical protein